MNYKIWNNNEFVPNPGPESRGYGAWYKNGKIMGTRHNDWKDQLFNMEKEAYLSYHIVERQISAQIGDRMALGVTKDFCEIEEWILENTKYNVLQNGQDWLFENIEEAVAFKLRWM